MAQWSNKQMVYRGAVPTRPRPTRVSGRVGTARLTPEYNDAVHGWRALAHPTRPLLDVVTLANEREPIGDRHQFVSSLDLVGSKPVRK